MATRKASNGTREPHRIFRHQDAGGIVFEDFRRRMLLLPQVTHQISYPEVERRLSGSAAKSESTQPCSLFKSAGFFGRLHVTPSSAVPARNCSGLDLWREDDAHMKSTPSTTMIRQEQHCGSQWRSGACPPAFSSSGEPLTSSVWTSGKSSLPSSSRTPDSGACAPLLGIAGL
eukprot:CAMPEP_0181330766 /NCGR_PEP_ID=MMETSP1101-20121128/24104_1 /TAXON_ID=46948 /ORGANISM="Rhodomonas abbreviata, Strain Caron Lab Isolate" /LENGTH=172 /DNA_ID=CAMNT_0023440103 /DNA_START=282 /DNA_END=800 /DNA_ORIENTATION=+